MWTTRHEHTNRNNGYYPTQNIRGVLKYLGPKVYSLRTPKSIAAEAKEGLFGEGKNRTHNLFHN